ncbi:hypothetical protein B0T24DRAFT_708287, partial [Lasiosphaeria ovina]
MDGTDRYLPAAALKLRLIAPEVADNPGSDTLDLEDAFKWTGKRIVDWIDGVINNVDDDEVVREKLKAMATLLKSLSRRERDPSLETGTGTYVAGNEFFAYKGYDPGHHIYRHGDLDPKGKGMIYKLKSFQFADIDLWSPYDLLGYLLMALGMDPPNATKRNFYLPLTAMYAKWCSKLAGHHPNDKNVPNDQIRPGNWPTVYQCTWLPRTEEAQLWHGTIRFALGASFQGADFRKPMEGPGVNNGWRARIIEGRKNQLQTKGFLPKNVKGDVLPPEKNKKAAWGNCGEVYPFLTMFRLV